MESQDLSKIFHSWPSHYRKTCNSDLHLLEIWKFIKNVWWKVFETKGVTLEISKISKRKKKKKISLVLDALEKQR